MRIKNGLIWLWILFMGLAADTWAVTDTIVYTYDNNQQIIRANYNNNTVIDYVYDGMGNRLVCSTSTSGVPSNNPPATPSILSPANGVANVPATTALSWTGGDPDLDDQIVYDIYLGTSGNPPLYREAIEITSFQPERLLPATTYYWKIKARDNHNAVSESPIWSFTTGNEAPSAPVALSPAPNSTIAYGNAYLSWQSSDPDMGDTLTYDVYFGTSATPPLVKSNHASMVYNLGALTNNTTYYWKITVKDNHGAITEGPVWPFITVDHIPAMLNSNITTNTTLSAANGPYIVGSSFNLQAGATLTIQPGTVLKVQSGLVINIYGTLIAQGQSNNPIIITSVKDDSYGGDTNGDGDLTHPSKGDWGQINFINSADASRLSYTKVFYAGGSGSNGAINLVAGITSIENCLIANNATQGIHIGGGSQNVTNSVFNNNTDYDIYIAGTYNGFITGNTFQNALYGNFPVIMNISANTFNYANSLPIHINADRIGKLLSDNTFTNVKATDYLEVIGGTITKDAVWTNQISYRILGSILVQGSDGADAVTTLTIQPGAKLVFDANSPLIIGANSGAPGALLAQGTAANPIWFTSGKIPQVAGDWSGIIFQDTTKDTTTILEYCIIQYAGIGLFGNSINVYSASPIISHCTVQSSQGDGINVLYGSPQISYNNIRYCGRYGININSGTPVIANNSFIGNANYDLYLANGANIAVTANTISRGLFVGSGILGGLSGNAISYSDSYPVRLQVDDIGRLLANNTISNVTTNSYLEVAGGTITKDATWTSQIPYRILNNIIVQGTDGADAITTLTIQPGAKLMFNQYTQLTIGAYSGAPGALNAQGTSDSRILFTSGKSPQAAGDWYGVTFNPTTNSAATILNYCTVQYAGYGSQGALYTYQCSPTIKNTIVSNNASYGVYVSNGSPIIQNCQFSNNANYDLYYNGTAGGTISGCTINNGIYFSGANTVGFSGNIINYNNNRPIRLHADNVSPFLAGGTIGNFTSDSYLEVVGGTISHDAAWTAMMPYRILGSITVQGTDGGDAVTTLTIQPGAKLLFNQYTSLTIGSASGAPGALIAQGTAANPILFTSGKTTPVAGDWYGISFQDTTKDTTTILDYCTIQYAGTGTGGYGVYIYSASPTISHCTIRYSQGDGIYVYFGSPQISYNNIGNCDRYRINVAYGTPTIVNNTFSSNANYDLYIATGTNVTVNANTFQKGIYVGNGILGSLSANIIAYHNSYPVRLHADDIGRLLTNNTIGNVTANSYLEVTAGTIAKDATWSALMPYRILGSITVQGTDGGDAVTTLTIQPGAKLLFNQYTSLTIGSASGAPGALIAQGTGVNPILFTSGKTTPVAGDWYGISFQDTTKDTTTILDYCTVEYAGASSSGYGLYIYAASPTLSHGTIRYSQGDGIYVYSGSPQINYNNIGNCGRYGINVNSGTPTIANNILANNGNFDLYLNNGTNITINANTIQRGLYIGYGSLVSLSANTITYNDNYPIRLHADDIGRLLANNTISNVTANSYLEVTAGTIARDATWSALMPYRILGSITVQGTDGSDATTTLSIQPGAKLMFNQNTGLSIGAASGAPGAINAQGTSANRIIFTSGKVPQAAGDWYGIYFYNTTSDTGSILNYCLVQYAGSGNYGAIYIDQASPTIMNTIVRNSSSYGVYVSNGSPIIQNCQFIANSNYDLYYSGTAGGTVSGCTINNGIYLSGYGSINFSGNTINYNNNRPVRLNANNVGSFMSTSVIGNTTPDSYLDVMGGIISKDAVWTNALIYHILGTITVQGTDGGDAITTLTIQPGAKLLFNQYTQLSIGAATGSPGALNAQGTTVNSILFTSGKTPQAAGDWNGIYFYNTTNDSATILDYCLVQYAGFGNYGAIYIDQASPTIRNSAMKNSSTYGLYVNNGAPAIQNSLFDTNGNYDLFYNGNVGGSVNGCTINKGISLLANGNVSFSGTTVYYNNTYPIKVYADNAGFVMSGTTLINVNANSYLSVNGGVVSHDAVWPAGIPYYIQNNVSVQGTDGVDGKTTLMIQPGVQLLFYQYTFLSIGNSTGAPGALIAQGTLEDPIWFTSSKSTPAPGDWYGVYFYNTADDSTTIMEYCNVEYGGYNNQGGIYIWDANPTLRYNNIANNKYGIYVYSGNPVITYNNIYNNTGYGLYRATTSILNAQDNWWGSATGPYHPTANPGGTGNAVSNYVNFTPWLTE